MLDLSIFETFETSKDRPLSIRRLILGKSFSFNLSLLSIVWKCRKLSLKGAFPDKVYFSESDRIHEALESHGGRFKISGLEHLRRDYPVVLVANHMSLLETMVLPWIVGSFKPLSIVMKKSLYDSWLFHPIAEATKSISLTRENLRADIDVIMTEGVAYLKQGRSILLFPEGTRKTAFDPGSFNSLGVKLAARAGVRIQPIALKTNFLERGKHISYAGTVHPERPILFEIGEAMEVNGRGKAQHQAVLEFMTKHLSAWGVEIKGGRHDL